MSLTSRLESSTLVARLQDLPFIPSALVQPALLSQFIIVGVIGGLIENITLIALVSGFELSTLISAAIGKECSILSMFVINDNWTFRDHRDKSLYRRVVQSNINRFGSIIIGLIVLFVLTTWLHVWYLVANLIGIGFGFIFNYAAESLLTWRIHDES